jgi:hypothetical protein
MNAKRRTLAVLAAVIAVLGLALWALNRRGSRFQCGGRGHHPAVLFLYR